MVASATNAVKIKSRCNFTRNSCVESIQLFCIKCPENCQNLCFLILHCGRNRFSEDIDDPVNFRVRDDEWRCQQENVVFNPADETAARALLQYSRAQLTGRWKGPLCGFVFDQLHPAHQTETTYIADVLQRCQLRQSIQ